MTATRLARATIAIPSFNQGAYLSEAIESVLSQDLTTEIIVMDGGSTDDSKRIIQEYAPRLKSWVSGPDGGQAAAINSGIAAGKAEYVGWLNSDDWLLPRGLSTLANALDENPQAPFAYGLAWNFVQKTRSQTPVWVENFSERRLTLRCIICQPATLMRRSCWEECGGLESKLHMAMDYDLWWRLFKRFGPPIHVPAYVAVNRDHDLTKTRNKRKLHYKEAIEIVRKHHGKVPMKWWLAQPYSVWFKSHWW